MQLDRRAIIFAASRDCQKLTISCQSNVDGNSPPGTDNRLRWMVSIRVCYYDSSQRMAFQKLTADI
jgi:hypothetical protein